VQVLGSVDQKGVNPSEAPIFRMIFGKSRALVLEINFVENEKPDLIGQELCEGKLAESAFNVIRVAIRAFLRINYFIQISP